MSKTIGMVMGRMKSIQDHLNVSKRKLNEVAKRIGIKRKSRAQPKGGSKRGKKSKRTG